jgi:hypothetical protein
MLAAPSGLLAVAQAAVVAQDRLLVARVVVARIRQFPPLVLPLEPRYTYQSVLAALVAYQEAITAALAATLGLTKPPTQHQPLLLTALLQRAVSAQHQQLVALVDLLLPA